MLKGRCAICKESIFEHNNPPIELFEFRRDETSGEIEIVCVDIYFKNTQGGMRCVNCNANVNELEILFL